MKVCIVCPTRIRIRNHPSFLTLLRLLQRDSYHKISVMRQCEVYLHKLGVRSSDSVDIYIGFNLNVIDSVETAYLDKPYILASTVISSAFCCVLQEMALPCTPRHVLAARYCLSQRITQFYKNRLLEPKVLKP